jgi:hypothetical protein
MPQDQHNDWIVIGNKNRRYKICDDLPTDQANKTDEDVVGSHYHDCVFYVKDDGPDGSVTSGHVEEATGIVGVGAGFEIEIDVVVVFHAERWGKFCE